MTIKYFFWKLKDVRFADYLSVFKLLFAKILTPFWTQYKGCWVICETPLEARDNGYHFFKYVTNAHPEIKTVYALKKQSPDYKKVAQYGNVIEYGSMKHWILYLLAEYNISSQKSGKPNWALCAFLELSGLIDSKLVFLQHGVIINDVEWLHADLCQLKYFVTSTTPEYDFIKSTFGHEENKIILTGLPRFDNLHNFKTDKKLILIMPTWRARFTMASKRERLDNDFSHSIYKKKWEELLNNERLKDLMNSQNIKVMFFLHRDMQPFIDSFEVYNNNIEMVKWEKYDIQEVLKSAALMITDYSSVFFDMVYMKKPVIFYQFDYEEFRARDYKKGYFDYKNNDFSDWCSTCDDVMDVLVQYISNGFKPSKKYLDEHKSIFPYYDDKNSCRIFDELRKHHG